MCGGGGSAPPPPDYAAQERERRQTELALLQAQQEQEAADRARKTSEFQSRLNPARQSAYTGAEQYFSNLGFNPADYSSDINAEIARAVGLIPEFDPNPGAYLSGRDIGEAVFNTAQSDARRGYEQDIYGFAPQGFATQAIPDTLDDSIIQSILTPEYEKANLSLNDALTRGILSAQGFQSAQNVLGQQKAEATARLGQVGSDTLESGRNTLRGIRDEGLSQAQNYRLGSPALDFSGLQGRIDTSLNDFRSNLEGNIRTNLGSDPLFDIGSVIAGARQSSFNPTRANESTALQQALTDREKERNKSRGIGNTGAF